MITAELKFYRLILITVDVDCGYNGSVKVIMAKRYICLSCCLYTEACSRIPPVTPVDSAPIIEINTESLHDT